MLYYPCIMSASGHIDKRVSDNKMTKEEAEIYIKKYYWVKWLRCEAIPQPITQRTF